MPSISLARTPDGWVADMADAEGADTIADLFGTTTIPTAFAFDADPIDVACRIADLNPGHTVTTTTPIRGTTVYVSADR